MFRDDIGTYEVVGCSAAAGGRWEEMGKRAAVGSERPGFTGALVGPKGVIGAEDGERGW